MQSRVFFAFVWAMLGTFFRRLLRGPRRPGWSFSFEAWVGTTRRFAKSQLSQPYAILRREWDLLASPPLDGVEHRKLTEPKIGGDLLIPGAATARTLFWVHGGGFCWGSSYRYVEMLSRVALLSRASVVIPNYRLAPEHRYPAAHEDVFRAYQTLIASGAKPENIVVGGDSAGANLALALVLLLIREKMPVPSALVLTSPWVDLARRGGSLEGKDDWIPGSAPLEQFARDYLGTVSPKDPGASPIYADLRGLPPTLVHVGTAELLYDQGVALAQALAKAKVPHRLHEFPDMVHGWHQLVSMFPQYFGAIRELASFVADPSRWGK